MAWSVLKARRPPFGMASFVSSAHATPDERASKSAPDTTDFLSASVQTAGPRLRASAKAAALLSPADLPVSKSAWKQPKRIWSDALTEWRCRRREPQALMLEQWAQAASQSEAPARYRLARELIGQLDASHTTELVVPSLSLAGVDSHVASYRRLTSLPPKLRVEGTAFFYGLESLIGLPDSFFVGKDLHVEKCLKLIDLGEHLHVARHVTLMRCHSLKSLPASLATPPTTSEGNHRAVAMADPALPAEGIEAFFEAIRKRDPFRQVLLQTGWEPPEFVHHDSMTPIHAWRHQIKSRLSPEATAAELAPTRRGKLAKIVALIDKFDLTGDHVLRDAAALQRCVRVLPSGRGPYTLKVRGPFHVADFPSLRAIPEDVFFEDDLDMSGSAIRSLRGRLTVAGCLLAAHSALNHIGPLVHVGRHIDVSHCAKLKAIPYHWLVSGMTRCCEPREVDLRGTRIREDWLASLVAFEPSGWHLRLDQPLPASSLARALMTPNREYLASLTFRREILRQAPASLHGTPDKLPWSELLDMQAERLAVRLPKKLISDQSCNLRWRNGSATLQVLANNVLAPHRPLTRWALQDDEPKSLQIFFERLRETEDYRASMSRKRLRERVVDMMQLAREDAECRKWMFELIHLGTANCEDRVALIVSDFDLKLQVAQALASDKQEQQITDIGMRLMRSECLQRYVQDLARKMKSRDWDQAEARLHLEVVLQAQFDLPTQPMHMRFRSPLKARHIRRAKKTLRRLEKDHDRKQAWLQNFDPYVQYKRKQQIDALSYTKLPERMVIPTSEDETRCPITLNSIDTLERAVAFERGPRMYVCEWADLLAYWHQEGRDPVLRLPLSLLSLFRPLYPQVTTKIVDETMVDVCSMNDDAAVADAWLAMKLSPKTSDCPTWCAEGAR